MARYRKAAPTRRRARSTRSSYRTASRGTRRAPARRRTTRSSSPRSLTIRIVQEPANMVARPELIGQKPATVRQAKF